MKRLRPVALLIAMVAVTAGVVLLGTDVESVKDIASIPAALPSFTAPGLSAVPDLAWGTVSVALVALAQAAGIAPSMPNPDGTRSDINGDFRSQGYANLADGLFQALPSGGSMPRTGVAVSAGARTRWAGIVSGVFLALVVLLCGSLAERVPAEVSSRTRAPLRSSRALRPWMVPCTKNEMSPGSSTARPSEANTPSARSPGVVGAFAAR